MVYILRDGGKNRLDRIQTAPIIIKSLEALVFLVLPDIKLP